MKLGFTVKEERFRADAAAWLGAQLSEAEKAGVEIVAISPDPNEQSQKEAEGLRLGYRFLAEGER